MCYNKTRELVRTNCLIVGIVITIDITKMVPIHNILMLYLKVKRNLVCSHNDIMCPLF